MVVAEYVERLEVMIAYFEQVVYTPDEVQKIDNWYPVLEGDRVQGSSTDIQCQYEIVMEMLSYLRNG